MARLTIGTRKALGSTGATATRDGVDTPLRAVRPDGRRRLRRNFGLPVERLRFVLQFMLQDDVDHLMTAAASSRTGLALR